MTEPHPPGTASRPDAAAALSVVVVTWNCGEYTLPLLAQLRPLVRSAAARCEIVVVDNASTDGTAERIRAGHPDVTLMCNPSNVGYTAAANLGIARSEGRVVLLLNPDLVLPGGFSLDAVLDVADRHPRFAVLGCVLLDPDARVQSRGDRWPTLGRIALRQAGIRERHPPSGGAPREVRDADWVSGAWMLVRSEVFRAIGRFDESFGMYGEDVEFCLRARDGGWRVGVIEGIAVVHHHSRATLKNLTPMLLLAAGSTARLLGRIQGRPLSLPRRAILAGILSVGAAVRGAARLLRGDGSGLGYLAGAVRIPGALLRLSGGERRGEAGGAGPAG